MVLALAWVLPACTVELGQSPTLVVEDIGDEGSGEVSAIDPSLLDAPPETIAIESGSISVRVAVDPFFFELRNADGEIILASPTETAVVTGDEARNAYGPPALTWNEPAYRGRVIWGWDAYAGTDDRWASFNQTDSVEIDEGRVQIVLSSPRSDATLEIILSVDENRFRVQMAVDEDHRDEYNRITQTFLLGEDEHFFGLGERFGTVDHRGRSFYCWTEEGGIGLGEGTAPGANNPSPNGWGMTNFPIPFVINTAGYGLWIDTSRRTEFHMGSHSDNLWRIEAADATLDYTVFVNSDPLRTIEDFTGETGRATLPAEWVFGPRRRVNLDAEVFDVPEWRALREFGVPTTAVDDAVHFLPHGAERGREEQLEHRAELLHDWGFKVIGYVNPYVSADSERVANDYERAVRNDYLMQTPGGDPYLVFMVSGGGQEVATIDMTNPEAVSWYQGLLSDTLDLGYDGWMFDFGEYVPDDAVFWDGRDGFEIHNLFPVLAQQAAFDLLEVERPGDYLFFVRSGYTGTTGLVPMVWSGDPNGSFDEADGLPSVVRAGINLGFSGVPFFGSGIGGFHYFNDPPPDKEVYLRWTEFAALTPSMFDENTGVGNGDPDERWNIWSDEETLEVYARYARLHTRLAPYFHGLALEAVQTGAPLMRHPYLLHPDDPATVAIDDQFYLGSALLVAPVVERDARERRVYFPEGTFVQWDTGDVFVGPRWEVVDAPLDSLPLFIADGGLVPLYDETIETLIAEDRDDIVGIDDVADVLDVRGVVSQGISTFTMADGTLLEVEVTGEVDGPFVMDTDTLMQMTDVGDMASCSACFMLNSDDPPVLRVTTSRGDLTQVRGVGITLTATHPTDHPRRVRWEIVLPQPPPESPEEE
jgi:alpha-glucosidase (family GH31 glycosyl hydrolase)